MLRPDSPIDKQLRKTDKRTRPFTDGPLDEIKYQRFNKLPTYFSSSLALVEL